MSHSRNSVFDDVILRLYMGLPSEVRSPMDPPIVPYRIDWFIV